jgi:WD40 repeat protein
MSGQPPPEAVSLPDPPTDGITALKYLPSAEFSSLLASTSFDGAVRIHDTKEKKCVLSQAMESGPLLSLATPMGFNALVTGGTDGTGTSRRVNHFYHLVSFFIVILKLLSGFIYVSRCLCFLIMKLSIALPPKIIMQQCTFFFG